MKVSKAEQIQRRAMLLQHVIAGHTYAQIKREMMVSEATVSRDLRALNDQLQQWAAEQQNRALATAIAQYQRVVDQAWADHETDAENEKRWLVGEFAEQTQVPDPVDGARVEKRTQQQFKSQKSDYLRVIVQATEKLCKLAGLERADIIQNNTVVMQPITVIEAVPPVPAPEVLQGTVMVEAGD